MSRLTDKQQRFVEEYTVDFNATQAAIRAGYSQKTARSIGSENLSKPDIEAAIQARVDELAMSANEALVRLGVMARGSLAPFHRVTADGDIEVDLSTKEARDALYLLTEMEVSTKKRENEDGSVEMRQSARLKIHDAKDALKQIIRVHGLNVQKIEHSGRIDSGVLVIPQSDPDGWDDLAKRRQAALSKNGDSGNHGKNGNGSG